MNFECHQNLITPHIYKPINNDIYGAIEVTVQDASTVASLHKRLSVFRMIEVPRAETYVFCCFYASEKIA